MHVMVEDKAFSDLMATMRRQESVISALLIAVANAMREDVVDTCNALCDASALLEGVATRGQLDYARRLYMCANMERIRRTAITEEDARGYIEQVWAKAEELGWEISEVFNLYPQKMQLNESLDTKASVPESLKDGARA
jgi:hypothetical protein